MELFVKPGRFVTFFRLSISYRYNYLHMPKLFLLIMWLAFPLFGFFGWFFYHKSKHEERKLLIEKGINPEEFSKTTQYFKFFWFKLGMVVMGLGLGLFVIALLVNLHLIGQSDAIYPGILCLCGGGSLVIANYLAQRKN